MSEAAMTAIEQMEARERRAIAAYNKDIRFRNIVQSLVAHEINKYGEIEPDRAALAAHRIATAVAASLLQAIYEDDAELTAQKALADRYRGIVEDALLVRPAPMFLTGKKPE